MANIPEFISVLRKIRDEIYPEVEATYENALILKAAIEAGQIQLDEDLTNMEQNVISLNAELDNVQTTIESYNRIQRIQKDIARLWDRR